MGATGVYDNDTALDFMMEVVNIASEKAESNQQILVVADMMSKYSYPSPLDSALFVQVITDELDNLDCWRENCREERKQVLLDLLSKSTKPYINENDNTIIYPLGITEEGDFIVQLFSKDSAMKEMELDIDYVMTNYSPDIFEDFEITLDGISNEEVQERMF